MMTPSQRNLLFCLRGKELGCRGVFLYLITVLQSAHCVLGGDGNYNGCAGLLSCPCGDAFPGASQGDGGGGTMKESRNPPPRPPLTPSLSFCTKSQRQTASLGRAALLSRINTPKQSTGHFCVFFCVYFSANTQNPTDPVYLPPSHPFDYTALYTFSLILILMPFSQSRFKAPL